MVTQMNVFAEACALGAIFFGGHTLLAAAFGPADIQPWATAIAGGICTIAGAMSWAYQRFTQSRKVKRARRRARASSDTHMVPDTRPDRQAGGHARTT
jgi:hypothetical protein